MRGGTKSKPGSKRKPKRPRAVSCAACKRVGRGQRPGSRTVHQFARRVSRELDR
jgi:hypothetical protein